MKLLAIFSLVAMMILPALSWAQEAVGPAPDDPCLTNETEGTEDVVGTTGTNTGTTTTKEAVSTSNQEEDGEE